MSILGMPRKIQKEIDKIRAGFLWHNGSRKRYHLLRWDSVCRSKQEGGLGILNMKQINLALLSKWAWRFRDPNCLGWWKDILLDKYARIRSKAKWSQLWKYINDLEQILKINRMNIVGNGRSVLFWEDTWIDDKPLKIDYSSLYNICSNTKCTVAEALSSNFAVIQFNRQLSHVQRDMLCHLQQKLCTVHLTLAPDQVCWVGGTNGKFSTKNVYRWLDFGGIKINWYQQIWDLTIPLKIKIFLVMLSRNRILTKVNLRKRGWEGSTSCEICGAQETLQHLFFSCYPQYKLWQWGLAKFDYNCQINSLSDLGHMIVHIDIAERTPFKIICAAVLWNCWLHRNDLCFRNGTVKSMRQQGLAILSTLHYWNGMWSDKVRAVMKELMPVLEELPLQLTLDDTTMP
ncbi:hypothetical protein LUZ61_013332 [Rhynchospora tenuis]|uniref:Reverse transcriptase zinc-binding domain-containing protein n=1 Tax=Rhynchospora tenuis TaxID=198213 RepID=A0AAD5WBV2_9POAL|nr:hypothetical protein LUZ61_013332 [Rhynchospora tenuis]